MIKRVNDEEGIRKLVVDVFQEMWFKPVHSSQESEILTRRVSNITAVVMALKDNNNNEWFEQLLMNVSNLLKSITIVHSHRQILM